MAIPKNKTIINIDDYTGFRWNGKHTSQLGLTVVSSSSRYSLNPISSITNNTIDIPGQDGQYYFNSRYGPKKWTINFVFDNLDDYQWRDLLNWLYHTDTSDLVFDELPYKAYNAKLEGTPDIKYLCFDEVKVKQNDNSLDKDTLEQFNWSDIQQIKPPTFLNEKNTGNDFSEMYYKKRIYKGEGTLNFIAFYPFAYSARDYNGKYMKYLDEIEFFPKKIEQSIQTIEIGNATTLTSNKKGIFQLNSIKGVTVFNDDNTVERGIIGNNNDTNLKIYQNDKLWTYFQLLNTTNDFGYENFDRYDNISDAIQFMEEDDNVGYKLIKKVGCIDLLSSQYIQNLINSTVINLRADFIPIKINFSFIPELLETIELSNDYIINPQSIPFKSNQFKIIENSQKENMNESFMIIENIKTENNKIMNIQCELNLTPARLRALQELIKENNTNYTTLVEKTKHECLLFFPCKEKEIELYCYSKSYLPLSENIAAEQNLIFGIKNKYGTKKDTSLIFETNFLKIPVLYDNFDEWKDSSGLLPTQKASPNYDECISVSDTQATYGYKVYNGGDLPTPFKITIPIVNNIVTDSSAEISFVLVQKTKSISGLPYSTQAVSYITELEKGVEYSLTANGSFIYYYYDVANYSQNKVRLLKSTTGEIIEYELNNKLYRKKMPKETIKALKSFSICFNNSDNSNSYGELIKNYTILAKNNPQYVSNYLEIDTYKQTINFISISTTTGKQTIIPFYFSLTQGELFTLPPKLDNLYILIYNQRESNSFITKDRSKVPAIEYKYLYL